MQKGDSPESEPDLGLFGPDSMVWRIHRNPAMLIGGLRALLLQALHPLAMAGVRDHSDYRADPWARYRRTRDYIVTTSFGTTESAAVVAKRVLGVHDRVNGIDEVTGQHYDAHASELLLWVHNCLVDSFLSSHQKYVEVLTEEDVNKYLTEMTRASELIGLPPDLVPTTGDSLREYFENEKSLCVTEAVAIAAKIIVSPPMFFALKPLWWGIALGAVDLLPAPAVELYGYKWLHRMAPVTRPYNRLLQRLGHVALGEAPEVVEAFSRAGRPIPQGSGLLGRVSPRLRAKMD